MYKITKEPRALGILEKMLKYTANMEHLWDGMQKKTKRCILSYCKARLC